MSLASSSLRWHSPERLATFRPIDWSLNCWVSPTTESIHSAAPTVRRLLPVLRGIANVIGSRARIKVTSPQGVQAISSPGVVKLSVVCVKLQAFAKSFTSRASTASTLSTTPSALGSSSPKFPNLLVIPMPDQEDRPSSPRNFTAPSRWTFAPSADPRVNHAATAQCWPSSRFLAHSSALNTHEPPQRTSSTVSRRWRAISWRSWSDIPVVHDP